MTTEQLICPIAMGPHHYHANRQLYVGTAYLALCCHCGRTQLIVYRGMRETTDLHWIGGFGSECGPFVRNKERPMNHSPGPWKIGPRLHHDMFASIMGADGHLIVNLGDGGNGIERQTANAELIAQAPDLLAEVAKLNKVLAGMRADAQEAYQISIEEERERQQLLLQNREMRCTLEKIRDLEMVMLFQAPLVAKQRLESLAEDSPEPTDKAIAMQAIEFLIGLLKEIGIKEGLGADYDGGSYAQDLNGLADFMERDL